MSVTAESELDIRAAMARRRWLRFASIILMLNGILGLISLGVAYRYISGPLGETDTIDASIDDARQQLVDTLARTGTTLGGAESAFAGLDDSLAQARLSSTSAAGVARAIGGTMTTLGQAIDIDLLGTRPFAGLRPTFELAGQQLADLGANLDGITAALSRNSVDIARTEGDLRALRSELDDLTETVRETEVPNRVDSLTDVIRTALYALMAWLAVFALASLLVGVALWRGLHPR